MSLFLARNGPPAMSAVRSLLGLNRTSSECPVSVAFVKVCGCRPHEGGAARTAGPAYANLQGRKSREVWRGSASDTMGISSLAVRCRGALTIVVGSDQRGSELVRSIAIAEAGVAQRGLIDESVARGVATASMVMADREAARQRRNGMSRRTGSGHDVSILITAVDAAGR
jgi:hypothetical protein